jgi:hypothetical protein
MSMASVARVVAIVLLLMIGGSGAAVGLQLVAAMAALGGGRDATGAWLAGGIGGYGLLLVAAAVGLVTRRRWAWALGSIVLGAGIAIIVAITVVSGPDEIVVGGLLIWTTALVFLGLARGVRGS